MKDEIEMFSLQIAHELDDFTAANVFPINHSLAFSVKKRIVIENGINMLFADDWWSKHTSNYYYSTFTKIK